MSDNEQNYELLTDFYDALDSVGGLTKEASKYDHIDFKPPQSVADAAARGLELRKKNKGKGGLSVQEAAKQGIGSGVARATTLKNRTKISPNTAKRMRSFFARHEGNKRPKDGKPLAESKGYIAWLLWGGDPGKSWADKLCRQMDAADKKKSAHSIDDLIKLADKIDPEVVITEHEGVDPVSYMAYSNLKNIIADSSELLSIMNSKDDLPQWADEALAIAKANVTKILGYVRSEKVK